MVSVFFADTVNAKARQTFTMTSIILAIPCGDRETVQASSAYSMPHTARRTYSLLSWSPSRIGKMDALNLGLLSFDVSW